MYRWKDDPEIEWPASVYQDSDEERELWQPDVQNPLVFHLFGSMSHPDTIVLSEDDYFDYLIGLNRHKKEFPSAVSGAFSRTALLFLGFEINDWSFRVLFRSIVSRLLLKKYKHLAVQIDPQKCDLPSPRRVRQYLSELFWNAQIKIYWGSLPEFFTDLADYWDDGGSHEG